MTNLSKMLIVLLIGGSLTACFTSQNSAENDWEVLFDGSDLDQWDTYLGPAFKPGITWANIRDYPANGVNNDTTGVFTIASLGGENVLRVSGEVWGGIFTKREFENYHLQLQFKWGEKRSYPREDRPRDSGLLYHGVEEHGTNDLFWLRSQEFQIQEGDCGDYWGVGGALINVRASLNTDSTLQYDPKGPLLTFSKNSASGRHCKKYPDAERTSGQWNTIDLYCFGSTSMHMMNGVLIMVLENSRQLIEEGREAPLTRGKIELQSEGAEIYFRNIRIRPIDELPKSD